MQVNCQPTQNIVVKVDQYRLEERSSYVQIVLKEVAGVGTIKSLGLNTDGVSFLPFH
jgi:hypothetical protein